MALFSSMGFDYLFPITFKPCADVASNLLEIDLQLNVRIAWDACNKSFNMLNILLATLLYLSQFTSNPQTIFKVILNIS